LRLLAEEEVYSDWLLPFFFNDAVFEAGTGAAAGAAGSWLFEVKEEAMGIGRESVLPTRIETGRGLGF
jgi:hypothetical protein